MEIAVQLIDANQRNIGHVRIASQVEELLTGEFAPNSDFPLAKELFGKFEEAVDVQALGVVDQLDKEIAALGLQLYSPEHRQSIKIHDVQIWCDGGFSCRVLADPTWAINGLAHATNGAVFVTTIR
jgi:hypothetical protein